MEDIIKDVVVPLDPQGPYSAGVDSPFSSASASTNRRFVVDEQENGLIYDSEAPAELKHLSLPEGQQNPKGYVYDASAGKGVTIYVFDSGIKTNTKVYNIFPINLD